MNEPFVFANGQVAHNAEDLIEICQRFPDDSVYYLIREDFEKWLTYIGATKIAQYAVEARQAAIEDRKKLDAFIAKFKHKPKTVNTATESKPKVNLLAALAGFFIVLFRGKSQSDKKSSRT